jgi:hypothetical protein
VQVFDLNEATINKSLECWLINDRRATGRSLSLLLQSLHQSKKIANQCLNASEVIGELSLGPIECLT